MDELVLNRRILVIDDNASIHTDFQKILAGDAPDATLSQFEAELFGAKAEPTPLIHYDLTSAYQGAEGLEKVQQAVAQGRPFAMAFVDVRMPPGWDGVQTIQKLWQLAPDMQAVLCTAYSDYPWQEIIKHLGRSDRLLILRKPFDAAEVRQLALTLTTKWELARQARLRHDELDGLVQQRTSELAQRTVELEREVVVREQAQQALRLTQFSVDRSADAVFWIRRDGGFHYVNDSAWQMLGYPGPELLRTRTIFDICPSRNQRLWDESWAKLEQSRHSKIESVFRRADGSEFPVELTVDYLRSEQSDYQCVFVRDVTARKRAEQALQDLVAGTSTLSGEEFFPALVWHLTRALDVKFAAVAELAPGGKGLARIVSAWGTELIRAGTDCVLENTPAARVLEKGFYSCSDDLPGEFPHLGLYRELGAQSYLGAALINSTGQVSGYIEVMDIRPLGDVHRAQSIINVFAARAASELERERMERALSQSEERYALAAKGASDGLWDWDLKTNEVYLSPRWKAMLGYAEEEVSNQPESWFERVHPEDLPQLMRDLDAHVQGLTEHLESEYRMRCQDGSYRWMLSRGLAVRAFRKAYRMAGSQTDITTRKQVEEQLRHDANHDRLTGLPNRTMFMDRLAHCLERVTRNRQYKFAVLFLDLDRFKVINDSLGHVAGDKLLVEISRRLAGCLRDIDTVARFDLNTVARLGGDEFTILLEDISDISDAVRVAQRIRRALSAPVRLGDQELSMGVSIGIASSATAYQRPEDILRDADTAMYHAKADGAVGYQVFDKNMHAEAVNRLQLESDLRRALQNDELRPWYQPIIRLSDGLIAGFEALVRWTHPTRGLVFPAQFIPMAEETGLIGPIGHKILQIACRDLRQMQIESRLTDLSVAVNISRRQLSEPHFVDEVASVLTESGLPPHCLILEITESVMMSPDTDVQAVQRLKDLGLRVLLDDFGTGYSSLCYLPSFPIDGFKIGPPFVTNLGTFLDYGAILKALTVMAHEMGLSLVAEGVETEEQLVAMKAFGCDFCQGHYFARPLDLEAARQRVLEPRRSVMT